MIGLSQRIEQADWHVLGIGSPHGDDQAGWCVVDALRRRGADRAVAIRNPSQLLDHLTVGRRALIVDACVGVDRPGTIYRAVWPELPAHEWRFNSTHHLDIRQVLELAGNLGRLPPEVVLLGIAGERFRPGDEMSSAVRSAVDAAVNRILRETSWMSNCHA